MNSRAFVRLASILSAVLLFAGCFGGGSKGEDRNRDGSEKYEGEFKEFDLYLHPFTVTGQGQGGWELYRGARVDAWLMGLDDESASAATLPGPTIRVREGDTVRINFYSGNTPMAHTLHWHGIHLPWDQDGVPYVSQLPIGPANFGGTGNVFSYEFKLNQSGTYWYHCHVDTAHHLDMGMYGAFIVDPADPADDPAYDQEALLVLDEWDKSHAHSNAMAINSALSKSGDPAVTANDMYAFMRDYLVMNEVYNDTVANDNIDNSPGAREERDWYPITYAPYFAEYDTYLINGKAFPDTEPIVVKSGDTLRLRIINVGSEVHALHLHGHHMYVTHKDGFRVPTLAMQDDPSGVDSHNEFQRTTQAHDTILIAPGERYDAYVILDNPGPWMIHDHIALNEANDYISPGGMSTTICYEDGWVGADKCQLGHEAIHGVGGSGHSDETHTPAVGSTTTSTVDDGAASYPSATSGESEPVQDVDVPSVPGLHQH